MASLVIFGISAIAYVAYPMPPSRSSIGGTTPGLVFGSAGFAFMIFAALLGARKKLPVWRVGRAQTWMRGHLWLGLLSFPLIVFHSGFRWGHGLSAVLMVLLIFVIASGLFGAALQHYMPAVMTREVTMETIYEEIDHVREQLREEAAEILAKATAGTVASAVTAPAGATDITTAVVSEEEAAPLRNFFDRELHPFLLNPTASGNALADAAQAGSAFGQLRTLVPPALYPALEELENICEEERQLTRQGRLHLWLHGWLLLHIPLSLALILLGAVHAVMSLRY